MLLYSGAWYLNGYELEPNIYIKKIKANLNSIRAQSINLAFKYDVL